MSILPRCKKNTWIGLCLVILLTIISIAGCKTQSESAPLPMMTQEANLNNRSMANSISANGVLRAARQIELSFETGGKIRTVEVSLGEAVQVGQVLAVLDATQAQSEVDQAKVELSAAEASYHLVAATIQAEKQNAALELIEAQQAYDALYEGAFSVRAAALQELAEANRAVEVASYQLYNYTPPASLADLESLDALVMARKNLDQARADFEPYKLIDSGNAQRSFYKEKLDNAQLNFNAALKLTDLEAELVSAQTRLDCAKTEYDKHIDGPDPAELVLVQARLDYAQAQFDQLEKTEADRLDLSQSQIDQARIRLSMALQELEGTSLYAPIDSVVSTINVHPGELAAPGDAVIELLDTSNWLIETKNVGELQIGRVQIGQEAKIWMNAFQGQALRGRVISIAPDAIVQQGDITYTLVIAIEPTDLNLRPGMTARIELLVEN